MSAHFKVYHFQNIFGKSVWEANGSPTLYKQCLGSLTSTAFQDMNENCETRLTVFSPRRLKSVTVCRWHWKSCTSRHLFKDLDRELALPGFETPASLSVDRCLSKRGDSLIYLCFTIKWICASLDRNESEGVREPIPYKPGGFSWASSPGEFK